MFDTFCHVSLAVLCPDLIQTYPAAHTPNQPTEPTEPTSSGRELPPLHRQASYDYGFQSFVPVPQRRRTLLPGDRLELT